jgi:hypothetical protein
MSGAEDPGKRREKSQPKPILSRGGRGATEKVSKGLRE